MVADGCNDFLGATVLPILDRINEIAWPRTELTGHFRASYTEAILK